MLSTKNIHELPEIKELQNLCKSISALEAIICPEWEYRYYSYNKAWSNTEAFCEMRNGLGDHLLILFSKDGAVINGFAHESKMNGWKPVATEGGKTELVQTIWEGVVVKLPIEFHEFVFGEPVRSIGTTFCIWRKYSDVEWQMGEVQFSEDRFGDGSADLLELLDGNPETYKDWAEVYYEDEFEERNLDLELVVYIYAGKPISKEMVLQINPNLEDFEKLWKDLNEIGYEKILSKSLVLETENLKLRIPSLEDIPHSFSATRYEGFNDGMLWEPPEHEDELIAHHHSSIKAWEEGGAYSFAIDQKETGEFLGRIVIRKTNEKDRWNVGFWTHPSKQRKGVMTEALAAVIELGFTNLGAAQIEACYAIWNKGSEKVLKRNGMQFDRYLEQGFLKKGKWVAENLMVIEREVWLSSVN